jgi:hypothetical protein
MTMAASSPPNYRRREDVELARKNLVGANRGNVDHVASRAGADR